MAALSNISAVFLLALLAVACTSARVPSHDRDQDVQEKGRIKCSHRIHVFEERTKKFGSEPDFKLVDAYARREHPILRDYAVGQIDKTVFPTGQSRWHIIYEDRPRRYETIVVTSKPGTIGIRLLRFDRTSDCR